MIEKVHIIISIVASLFVTIICLVTGVELLEFALKLSMTIIGFYFLGYLIKSYLKRKIFIAYREYDYEEDVPPIDMIQNKDVQLVDAP